MSHLLFVCLGGALGSGLRYLVSGLAARWFGAEFPYGTLLVNLGGSFAIGLVQELGLAALLLPDHVRLFLAAGVLGGLTTYSTFSYETLRLVESGAWPQAWVYVLGTTGLSLLLCFLGIAAGRGILMARG
ncbi:MAG TPA: fluoride efflux transporter CrcB [Methylomirabilota bacterium]|nr:fluoride efflux transporter CrcB [Methylomirabilota bacterium]